MKNKLFISVLFASLILYSCSTEVTKDSEESRKDDPIPEKVDKKVNEVDLSVNKIYSWVNLMPSTTKGNKKFHVTGDISINLSDGTVYLEPEIKQILVTQDDKIVYYIKPTLKTGKVSSSHKQLLFSTISGLQIVPELDYKKNIDLEIQFLTEDGIRSYFIENLKVVEAQ